MLQAVPRLSRLAAGTWALGLGSERECGTIPVVWLTVGPMAVQPQDPK